MKKPSKTWLTVAVAGCIFASSMGTYTYQSLADEFVYSDANVSITSIVDRYIEENGNVFTTASAEDATPEDAAAATEAVLGDATATDAVASGQIVEIARAVEETTEATTEATMEEMTTEAPTTEAAAETAAASPTYDFTGKAIVTASGTVNIRQSGDVNAQKVGTITTGGIMNVVEKGDTWSHITSGSVDGYIKNEFIAFDADAANYASANLSKAAVVNTAALNLRSEASTDSETVTLLAQGESYPIAEIGDAWTKIQVDTAEGYVKNEYIMISYMMPTAQAVSAETTTEAPTTEAPTTEAQTTEAPTTEAPTTEAQTTEAQTTEAPATTTTSDLGQQIASFACQFVGNPYVYGGTSLTNGADCSGFVQSVYKNFGYSLPRTATTQSGAGTVISLAALQPGDLVFYDHGSGSIEHVGIYIGNGQIVHASNRRTGIKISSVNYSTPFMACRIIN